MKNYLNIVNAEYLYDYKVRITFADHTVRDINFGIFLFAHPHPQYNKFRDLKNFKKFQLKNGNIVWGRNADLCFHEDELYKGINPS